MSDFWFAVVVAISSASSLGSMWLSMEPGKRKVEEATTDSNTEAK